MKRGLKVVATLANRIDLKVEEDSPMKRGLKVITPVPDAGCAALVEEDSPMKRGLKATGRCWRGSFLFR